MSIARRRGSYNVDTNERRLQRLNLFQGDWKGLSRRSIQTLFWEVFFMSDGDIHKFFEDETRPFSCECSADYFQCIGGAIHEIRETGHVCGLLPEDEATLMAYVNRSRTVGGCE